MTKNSTSGRNIYFLPFDAYDNKKVTTMVYKSILITGFCIHVRRNSTCFLARINYNHVGTHAGDLDPLAP
jgi:hypothetical protein